MGEKQLTASSCSSQSRGKANGPCHIDQGLQCVPDLGPREHYLNLPLQQSLDIGFLTTLCRQASTLRLREGVSLIQGHAAGEWQSFFDSRAEPLTPLVSCSQMQSRAGPRGMMKSARKRQEGKEPDYHSLPAHILQKPSQISKGSKKPGPKASFPLGTRSQAGAYTDLPPGPCFPNCLSQP